MTPRFHLGGRGPVAAFQARLRPVLAILMYGLPPTAAGGRDSARGRSYDQRDRAPREPVAAADGLVVARRARVPAPSGDSRVRRLAAGTGDRARPGSTDLHRWRRRQRPALAA